MKLSDYIVHFFEQQKVTVVFGYIGGMITHLVDSIAQSDSIRFIQVYHEQTASIAAEGYAKESGKIGVAIATSGPGATNMMTGIADAYFDSIPVIYITGQINSYEYKYDKPIRQQGFQETDIVKIVESITKYATLVDDASRIRHELEKACYIAKNGRPGPVLLDIPMDIQRAEIDPRTLQPFVPEPQSNHFFDWDEIIQAIARSKRPMILSGAGCQGEEAKKELYKLVSKTNIPVVSSLLGKGSFPEMSPSYMGMIGSYGNRCANMAIANADLLIALGSRLDVRQTGAMLDKFIQGGTIIHVDIDTDELDNHRLNNRIKVHSSVADFLKQLNSVVLSVHFQDNWIGYMHQLKKKYNQSQEIDRFVENKSPYRFLQLLNNYTKEGDIFCADVGQNQMWAAQTIDLKANQKFVTSGGLAPMGFSLPVSIGTAFASPDKNIISINGDGGFQMAIQSLMLIAQYDLPIKIVVMNNQSLGMITQFQQLYFEGKMIGTVKGGGYIVPDIRGLSAAYGLKYYRLNSNDLDNSRLLNEVFNQRNCVIEYIIDGLTTVSPKLEFNRPIEQTSPLLPADELKDNMLENSTLDCEL